ALLCRLQTLEMQPVERDARVVGWRPWLVRLDKSGRDGGQAVTAAPAGGGEAPHLPRPPPRPGAEKVGSPAPPAPPAPYPDGAAGLFDDDKADVCGESVKKAAALVAYFKAHARRVHASMATDRDVAKAKLIWAWVVREGRKEFKRWEPYDDVKNDRDVTTPE